jgi:RsmE family RNA methyltransferase
MNLILLFEEDFTGPQRHVRLSGRRHAHVRQVHRAVVGDELCVGLAGGPIGTGRVTVLDDRWLEMEVTFRRAAPPPLPIILVLALPRPTVLKRILGTVTAMGVKQVILFHSYRVEKSYWKSPALDKDNIHARLVLGLEQARDTILPEVTVQPLFKPFVEDVLPGVSSHTLALVAHPQSVDPCPRGVKTPVTLVVGPEGGFIPYEIEKLTALGFTPVCLEERILRVETAVTALLSRLS